MKGSAFPPDRKLLLILDGRRLLSTQSGTLGGEFDVPASGRRKNPGLVQSLQ